MRIAIIGGGVTGLAAAYFLNLKKCQTVLFEKEDCLGGLSAGFKEKKRAWFTDDFFHHLFPTDQTAKKLLADLNLESKVFFQKPKTSIFQKGKISRFDSPLSVLTSPHFSLKQKARIGLTTVFLKTTPNWEKLEKFTAKKWLEKYYGPKVYQTLWQPLLKAKFGPFADQISMIWFWARIKKRSTQLGYLKGGFQVLINQLVKEIKKNRGQIFLDREIKKFTDLEKESVFDRYLFTTPTSVFLKIMGTKLPLDYRQKLSRFKMIGALNLILALKKPFLNDNTYWLNVNQKNFPFVAVVEHTNFISPKHYQNNHLVYVGGYYPQNHRYFKTKKEAIFKKFFPFLKKINPDFGKKAVSNYWLKTNLFAQPVIETNYSKIKPTIKTPIPNVFLANMQTIYPWDRGINYAIQWGEKAAHEISKKN